MLNQGWITLDLTSVYSAYLDIPLHKHKLLII